MRNWRISTQENRLNYFYPIQENQISSVNSFKKYVFFVLPHESLEDNENEYYEINTFLNLSSNTPSNIIFRKCKLSDKRNLSLAGKPIAMTSQSLFKRSSQSPAKESKPINTISAQIVHHSDASSLFRCMSAQFKTYFCMGRILKQDFRQIFLKKIVPKSSTLAATKEPTRSQ